jgi:ATP-dependent Clp protease protease subunit
VVFLGEEVNSTTASLVISQLLYLESVDNEKDISLYINSPGGSISDGLAIYDTMNFIKCDVQTICVGLAASMGAFLLAAGAKGKRMALPNSEILIHQPLGGMQGQASDIKIHADHILTIKGKMNSLLSQMTGQPLEVIERDTDRDNYFTAAQACEYGLIDKVVEKR